MAKKAALGDRRSDELTDFCKQRLDGKTANDLHEILTRAHAEGKFEEEDARARVPSVTSIKKFLAGKRTIGVTALRILAPTFCRNAGDAKTYEHLLAELKDQSLRAADIDAIRTYHYLSVPYAPLSGSPSTNGDGRHGYFAEKLLVQLGQLAYLDFRVNPALDAKIRSGEFDMHDRIEALRAKRADVLINLVSLPRLRLLRFITTPVSISLNGVVLNDVARVEHVIDAAAGFLSGTAESTVPFKALVIESEVGKLHADWMNTRLEITGGSVPSEVEFTLNHQRLANRLIASRREMPPLVLFCDELTALGVLRALEGKGRLLFPLNSDASIARYPHRRSLPTHQLGIGYLMEDKGTERLEDMDRIAELLFPRFLESEREMVTALYIDLYKELKKHVESCLEESPDLYVGGVRRVRREEVEDKYRAELTAENARAHVRRCLQLSRGTIELLREDDPWTPILRRARERLQTEEARTRPAVRASLLTALSMAAGLDPCKAKISKQREIDEVALKNRTQLRQLLERDLDVVLPQEDAFFDSLKGRRGAGIERFVSKLQEVLEKSTRTTHVTIVLDREQAEPSVQKEADRLFKEFRQGVDGHQEHKRLELIDRYGASVKRKLALSLGEPVGILFYRSLPSQGTKDLIYVWVPPHVRKGNTAPLLVRKVIEDAADKPAFHDVSFDAKDTPPGVVAWFKKLGFTSMANGTRWVYQLERFKAAAQPGTRRPARPAKRRQ
jgi:hypothetical protein